MTELLLDQSLKPIVISIDRDEVEPATIELAVAIAMQLKRPLQGVFIEDTDLAQVASLPFSTEICFSTGAPRRFDSAELQGSLQRMAAKFRSQLALLAEKSAIQWSCHTVRARRQDIQIGEFAHAEYLFVESAIRRVQRSKRYSPAKRLLIVDNETASYSQAVETIIGLLSRYPLELIVASDQQSSQPSTVLDLARDRGLSQVIDFQHINRTLQSEAKPVDYIIVARQQMHDGLSELLHHANCPVIVVGANEYS